MKPHALVLVCPLILLLLIALPAAAQAPESSGRAYVLGGAAWVHQPGPRGNTNQTYITAPGGHSIGWLAGVGGFPSRTNRLASLELEVSSTGLMKAHENSRYGHVYDEERRDRMAAGLVRFHLPIGPGADVEPVVGFAVVRAHIRSTTSYGVSGIPVPNPLTFTEELDGPTRAGLVTGVDVRVGGPRVSLLPSFRWMRSGDGLGELAHYPNGFPKTTIRIGAALRIDF